MKQSIATVLERRPIGGGYNWLVLEAPEIALPARPGQFVHLRVPALEPSALRRPFSICDSSEGRLSILYKEVGRGTAAMAGLAPGSQVDLIGPLGNGFPLELPADSTPLLVGGGYGVAPLLFLARGLSRAGARRGVLMAGGRTAADLLLRGRFAELGWEERFSTADGSAGVKGLVTDVLDSWLAGNPGSPATIFACGPDGMLRAVGARAGLRGDGAGRIDAWLSLDKRMACGVGACLACVQKVRSPDGAERLASVCRDGPVFESREIVW